MAGKHGQSSTKATQLPEKYAVDFITELDGRCSVVKELRSRLAALRNDLGGEENLSYQMRSLTDRIVHIEAVLQSMERDLINGVEVPLGSYIQSINTLASLLKTVGLKRVTKNLNLREYIAK